MKRRSNDAIFHVPHIRLPSENPRGAIDDIPSFLTPYISQQETVPEGWAPSS